MIMALGIAKLYNRRNYSNTLLMGKKNSTGISNYVEKYVFINRNITEYMTRETSLCADFYISHHLIVLLSWPVKLPSLDD